MIRRSTLHAFSLAALLLAGFGAYRPAVAASDAIRLPAPVVDASRSGGQGDQVAVFAGGCFWGVEAVFEHVKGVRNVVVGYSGGSAATAHYDQVGDGDTGHAESVRVQFDPARVSYGQLLQVLFSVAMDPTQLNRQGPDRGAQYRSVVFYGSPEQKRIALAYVAQLTAARSFPAPIVTQVVPLSAFYPAEAYHQDYARRHPDNPYIIYNDAPKVKHLQQLFPALYRSEQDVVDVQLH